MNHLNHSEPLLRSGWRKIFPNALVCSLVVLAILTALRAYGMLGSDTFESLLVMLGFALMWAVPFVFLTREGRRRIGIVRPLGNFGPFVAIACGVFAALACFGLGHLLYGRSEENWFVSVGYSYLTNDQIAVLPQKIAFLVFTIPAMLFSPIGEEFLFRGFIHRSAEERWDFTRAALLNASLFAAVHLLHHGIYRVGDSISVLWTSGAIWFALMFLVSLLFTWLARHYRSIWTAVIGHAFFNLAMNYTIFYHIFVTK